MILLLMGLLTFSGKIVIPSKAKIIFLGLSLFYLLSGLYNFDYFTNTIFLYFDVVYFFFVFITFWNDSWFRTYLFKIDLLLVIIIATSTILSFLVYIYNPSYFLTLEVADYPVFYNRFLGLISAWNYRTCWFFAEPSYCGFYLGLHFFIFLNHNFKKGFLKVISLVLIIGGLAVTSSLGSFIYIILSFAIYIGEKLRINKRFLLAGLYVSLFTAIFILPQFDVYKLNQNAVDVEKSSFDDRQNRMVMAQKIRNEMTITDYFFGSGVDAVAVKFRYGISDVYNKLLCEQGILFLIFFLLFVRKLTRNHISAYSYILFSFLSVIIHATPIVLIVYLSIFHQTRLKNNKNAIMCSGNTLK